MIWYEHLCTWRGESRTERVAVLRGPEPEALACVHTLAILFILFLLVRSWPKETALLYHGQTRGSQTTSLVDGPALWRNLHHLHQRYAHLHPQLSRDKLASWLVFSSVGSHLWPELCKLIHVWVAISRVVVVPGPTGCIPLSLCPPWFFVLAIFFFLQEC